MAVQIRAQLSAGPLAFPWAQRLAADWTLAGLAVSLRPSAEPPLGPDEVRLRLVDHHGFSSEARLHLSLRKMNVSRAYLLFEVLGEQLRSKESVNFENASDQAFHYLQDGPEAVDPSRLENSIFYVEPWLLSRHRLALVILVDLLSEIYVPDELGELRFIGDSLLEDDQESPPWLQAFEARRLLLLASKCITTGEGWVPAEDYLRPAKRIARALEDPVLLTRADGMIGLYLASEGQLMKDPEREAKGFARADRAWRRAQKQRDLPTAVELAILIAAEKRWYNREAEGLETLEKTAIYAAKHGGWLTPRLAQQLMYYRAVENPSVETMTPLVEEIFTLLDGGWTGWFPSLDYLELVQRKVGERRFKRYLCQLIGKRNAIQIAADTDHGRLEYKFRHESEAVHKKWLEKQAQRAAEEAAKPPALPFTFRSGWPPYFFSNG